MSDILAPTLGESVSEATVARWTKKPGDPVKKDEVLVELETDKVSLEVAAPADGVLGEISAEEGATVTQGQKLGSVDADGAAKPAPVKPSAAKPAEAKAEPTVQPSGAGQQTPANQPPAAQKGDAVANLSPSVQRIVAERNLDPANIRGTGPDGRITKGDALQASPSVAVSPAAAPQPAAAPAAPRATGEREERVKMTRLRQTIAKRLKDAQNAAAMLTTFNEVDMSHVMALRNQYKDVFEKKHGVKLGFMSFFTRACIAALKEVPDVNAEIDGTDVIYKNHYDIGVAVGTERGLVVPVVRDADQLSLAGIEKAIAELGKKARDGKLAIEDLQGGTFTITNGGVYGSLMSTPILNAPQSGVLGMHNIVQRPIAVDGAVVIRPMMYLALSYDHRIVDGKGAVTFLVAVKNAIEDPQRLLLDV
jgi:2-oxoglutarate dehydrogenase E2 component (dihydrolipoamide succinyltransferase)